MTHDTPTPTPSPVPLPRPEHDGEQDELAVRVAAALRSREPAPAETAASTERIAARLAAAAEDRDTVVTPFGRRASRVVVTGLVTSTIVAVGAGAAAAANPYTGFAAAVEGVVHAVGVEWSAMPAGYTREQYEAFWGAGYTSQDVLALGALWQTDGTETKARAGQMILDGDQLPLAPAVSAEPGGSPEEQAAREEFWDAGYTAEDLETLTALWDTDAVETKALAGRMLLDGESLPIEPSGDPTATE
ncbi:hypothetical protein [Actinotalea sp. C106]|uniref:hypothetical protein n=1 Tax=Actinotalea sp. C106 TaxID=2908644 RepID=UPI0020295E96|nr:hypothetical protein [Actinotalea sp. C106]